VDRDETDKPPRLLLVHAHPDDETTTTGATIARYCASGALVTLVTCTRGERGENVLLDSPGYGADENEAAEQLGRARVEELEKAARALGLYDVRFLGGVGTWWDSGMADARVPHPRAFSEGSLAEQTAQLVEIVREVRPHVMVTYDERGGYGHPDHIRAHEVAMAAFDAAADPDAVPQAGPAWSIERAYAAVVPHSVMRSAAERLTEAEFEGGNPLEAETEELPFGVPDELVSARVDAREWIGAKASAMRAHRTQMGADSWFFVLADDPGRQFGVEHYRVLRSRVGDHGEHVVDDLFA
jgi:N-acetyl-1-D-myo-inositol-2-amino-2-deoxy-alpha-D-glucopyranoside deacetylase